MDLCSAEGRSHFMLQFLRASIHGVMAGRTKIEGATALIAGMVVNLVGLAVLFFILKGFGDILFPEIPGLTLARAILYQSIVVLVDSFLFFEGYRLLKAATAPKPK